MYDTDMKKINQFHYGKRNPTFPKTENSAEKWSWCEHFSEEGLQCEWLKHKQFCVLGFALSGKISVSLMQVQLVESAALSF